MVHFAKALGSFPFPRPNPIARPFVVSALPAFLFLCLFPLTTVIVGAPVGEAPVEITVKGQAGYPLALQGLQGPAGSSASKTLDSALRRSGRFRLNPTPSGSFVVSGSAHQDRIDGQLRAPGGSIIFSRTYRSGDPRRDLHQFADDIVFAVTGMPGIASSQIVFVSTKTGKKEIYLCDYDGGNVRQVTHDASISVSPSISPDRSQIVYTSYRSGYPDVYIVNLRNGARSRIIKSPGTNSGAAFAPSGDRIALTMSFSGNPELYVTNTRGSGARRLTRTRAVDASPSWFSDSQRLVFVSNQSGNPQIYQISANGGKASHLAVGYGYCTAPSISPDGNRLAFAARISGRMEVASHEFGTRHTATLTSGGDAENPSWAPDSRHLVYTKNGDLYVHDVDTGEATRILSGMGRISEPNWSR